MSRNSSGVYSLPSGSQAVAGATLDPVAFNAMAADIAAALTDSLPVNGATGMTGALPISDGSAGAPAIKFTSAPSTGLYKTASGWAASVGGTKVVEFTSAGAINASGNGYIATTAGLATAADYQAGTAGKALQGDVVWTAAAPVAITFASTITADFNTGVNFTIAATGNFTLANPTNAKPGQSGAIRIQQDATGSRTITYGTAWKFPSGMNKALTTTANAIDYMFYFVKATGEIAASLQRNYA